MAEDIAVRPIEPADRDWVVGFLRQRWGTERMVVRGAVFYPADHPGFVALHHGEATGLLTYRLAGQACEITLLDSGVQRLGIGTALINAMRDEARRLGCTRLWLVTTNDNLDALRFYQRRRFVLAALHRDSLRAARALKPEIPLVGAYGIPLRDELELEMPLS